MPDWFRALILLPLLCLPFLGIALHAADDITLTEELHLWPGAAPGVPANPGEEIAKGNGRVSHVSVPTLDVYLPPKPNGIAIIICSGGGYVQLATRPLGKGAAEEFLPDGFTIFSLKYRLKPPSTDVATDARVDGARAVRLVRSRAAEWHLRPDRIGMVGFSAGSNMILNVACRSDAGDPTNPDPVERFSSRPDFIGLCAHWAYAKRTPAEHGIIPGMAPVFIAHARDDHTAPFGPSEAMAADFAAAKVPVHFEAYDTGDHMGFNFPKPKNADWPAKFRAWLTSQQLSP